MRRVFTVAVVVGMGLASSAQAESYGWTISASSTDPFENAGTATSSVATLYLWLQCAESARVDGMSAAEFDIVPRGMQLLATTPQNPFLNAGGVSNILLAGGGCPAGPVVAATLLVIDTPGDLCLAPSAENGTLGTVDCEALPEVWPTAWMGYSNRGNPCSAGVLCRAEFVRESSLGEVKGLYRDDR